MPNNASVRRKQRPTMTENYSARKKAEAARRALSGATFLVLAVIYFWYLSDFENSNDKSRMMWWPVALLYTLGGKWIATGVLVALSALMFFLASASSVAANRSPFKESRRK
jgi:Na+/melibiose symporter-like transporter